VELEKGDRKRSFLRRGWSVRVQTITIDVNMDWDGYAEIHRKDHFTCMVRLGYDDVEALLFAT
jgi:hypothetical protein